MTNPRKYGNKPYNIAVVHGGPGAPGEMAPVARELSSITGVLEPLQTQDSVEGQVAELRDVLEKNGDLPVTLIGFSWGAWLSFILTARHPSLVRKLILIGSAPFLPAYEVDIMATRLNRLNEEERIEILDLIAVLDNPAAVDKNQAMARFGELMAGADSYDPLPHGSELLEYRYDINYSVWQQASKLRSSGELLRLGGKIRCPVVAVHGDYDPHPAEGVREPLARVLKDFKFIMLEKCGHEPWLEKYARDKFYETLRREIA
jgi:pimeloyl-ACP methyl ester carboxylesterase